MDFWRKNKSLKGLSVRTLFMDVGFQTVILFSLIEEDASLLVTVPAGAGVLIQVCFASLRSFFCGYIPSQHSGYVVRWRALLRVFIVRLCRIPTALLPLIRQEAVEGRKRKKLEAAVSRVTPVLQYFVCRGYFCPRAWILSGCRPHGRKRFPHVVPLVLTLLPCQKTFRSTALCLHGLASISTPI